MHFMKLFKAIIQRNTYWLLLPPALLSAIFGMRERIIKVLSILCLSLKGRLIQTYSERCQTCKMECFAKIVNGFNYFCKTPPSYIFERVRNTSLVAIKIFTPETPKKLFENRSKKKTAGRTKLRINTSKRDLSIRYYLPFAYSHSTFCTLHTFWIVHYHQSFIITELVSIVWDFYVKSTGGFTTWIWWIAIHYHRDPW